MATNVIIQSNPLADFLNKIPELIFEAKSYGEELDWKTEQAELERAHEKEIKDLEFNRQFAGQLYQQNQALEQSIAELGIISTQAENLPDEQKTPGFDSFTDVISGKLEGDSNQIKETISYLEEDYGSNLKTIASYNMGKNLFTQVDQNADGTIDDEEKAKYAEEYGDLDIDYNAFSQGIYASELGAEQLAALDLSKEQLLKIKIENKYLPDSLKADLSIKNKTIDTMDKDLEVKDEQLKKMDQDFALGVIEIDAANIKLGQLEDETTINQTTFNNEQTQYLKNALVEQQTRDQINAQAIAQQILSGTFLVKSNTITSMFDFIVSEDGRISADTFEDRLGWFKDQWDDVYETYEYEYGKSASIESDILGLFNAVELGWDNESGTMAITDPFLKAVDVIHAEVQDIKKTNPLIATGQYNEIKNSFEKEHMLGAYDNPKEFIQYLNEKYVDADGNPELTETELIQIARYMQYKQSGLLDGDLLETNRKLLDNINKADTLLETVTAQEYDEYDRLK